MITLISPVIPPEEGYYYLFGHWENPNDKRYPAWCQTLAEYSPHRAISRMLPALADISVVLIDDWNFREVWVGTERALTEVDGMIVYRISLLLSEEDFQGLPNHTGRHS